MSLVGSPWTGFSWATYCDIECGESNELWTDVTSDLSWILRLPFPLNFRVENRLLANFVGSLSTPVV